MRNISYEKYFDKVYGCFLGKCIGGTAGGPAEGRKELLDAPLNEEILHSTLPNDDLDLQILWLELLEEKGANISAHDMAKEFYEKVPYGPGEYGFFKKSYAAGIYPPVSGVFNNRYYKNGMGCPIRSEIWACLFPGCPSLAKKYVEMDGSIDHQRDSIDAEYFLTVLESEAFFANGYEDMPKLFATAIESLPEGKIRRALTDTYRWYNEGRDWKYTRGMILRNYGHSDCTNLYQNMSFTLLSLLYGKGDFRETIRVGLACGYDTDCICATAAAILGIFRGAKALLEEDKMTDTGLLIGIGTRRKEGSIKDLAADVCAAGMSLVDTYSGTSVSDRPEYKALPESEISEFTVTAIYDGDPILIPNRESRVTLNVKRNTSAGSFPVSIKAPDGVIVCQDKTQLTLSEGEEGEINLTVRVSDEAEILRKANIFEVTLGDFTDTFGLMGGTVWHRYGPFLMNNCDLTETVLPHQLYAAKIPNDPDNSQYDAVRDFHLNSFADINREFVPEAAPFLDIEADGSAEREAEIIYTGEDLFDLADIQGYQGPHTDYLVTTLISPAERAIELAVGHTAPFKLWINGTLIGTSERSTWWTCENRHFTVVLKEGENRIVLKCAQLTDSAKYSLIPRRHNGRWVQHSDIDCKIIK